jgi:hypothetical protein
MRETGVEGGNVDPDSLETGVERGNIEPGSRETGIEEGISLAFLFLRLGLTWLIRTSIVFVPVQM